MWEIKKAPEPPLASTLGTPSDLTTPGEGQSLAQIGKSLKLKGEITGNEDLYIDGEVEGRIELKEHSLTVGLNGKVHADVSARSITILGHLQGNVKAGERTEIRKTGSFDGELLTAQIVIKDGAVFRGSVDVVKPGQNAANTPAADGPARTGTPSDLTTPGEGQSLAQIGKSLKLKGEITGNEDLYIDGEVEGRIELKEHSLTVGLNGKVHADVSARSITIPRASAGQCQGRRED